MFRFREEINKKTGIVVYLSIALCLVFISNIFMHVTVLDRQKAEYHTMVLHHTKGYRVEGNQYFQVDEDPQMYFTCMSDSLYGIRIDFAAPLASDTTVELYYPDVNGRYEEKRSRKAHLTAGETTAEIDLEPGKYAVLRIDINGDFSLEKISQNSTFTCIPYARKSIRYCVWGACLLCSLFVTFLLFRAQKWRKCIEKIYTDIIQWLFVKDYAVLLCSIFVSILLAGVMEGLKTVLTASIFNSKEMWVFAGIIFVILSFLCMRKYYHAKIEKMTFILLLFCGIIYALVLPVSLGISWDDETHYNRTVSCARYLSHTLTSAEWTFGQDYTNAFTEPEKLTKAKQEANRKYWDSLSASGGIERNENYKWSMKDIGYLPAVLGVWISYGLCLSFSHSIILIRIINVLFVAVMVYLSMRSVKSGKLLIAAMALVPTFFYLASNFSYDTWLTVLLIYGFARYFGEVQHRERKLSWKNFLGIFLPLFLALAPKVVYAPMLFLTAYMPKEKFKEKKWCIAYRACFVLAAIIFVSALIYMAGGNIDFGTGDSRGGAEVNPNAQFVYIRQNFGTFMETMINFLKSYFSYSASADYLSFMAYLGQSNLQIISILLLGFVALTDHSQEDRKLFPIVLKLSSVFMYVLIGAICAFAMYLSFTPVGASTINGCQGRYIIPAILPVLFIISRFGKWNFIREKCLAEYYNFAVLGSSVFCLLYHLWINCAVKYC